METTKRLYRHIEWSLVVIYGAFSTLAITLKSNQVSWFVVCSAIAVGIALAIIAAKNSYRQKSIDRMIQIDREFRSLGAIREQAAKALLSGTHVDEVDEVLDFLDSPIGQLVASGDLDPIMVYDYFFEWIRGYWWSANSYIRSKTDPTQWEHLATLYATVSKIHQRKTKCSDLDLRLSDEDQKEFLKGES